METMNLDDFKKEAEIRFGKKGSKWKFICPICGTAQSAEDLVAAGVPKDKVGSYIGFSCVGRWTEAGPHKKDDKPGKGCDWTLGGLFSLHKLEIEDNEGKMHPHFELAPKEG